MAASLFGQFLPEDLTSQMKEILRKSTAAGNQWGQKEVIECVNGLVTDPMGQMLVRIVKYFI